MTLKELNELFENKNLEIVLVDENNVMHSIHEAELKTTKIGQMIMLKVLG